MAVSIYLAMMILRVWVDWMAPRMANLDGGWEDVDG